MKALTVKILLMLMMMKIAKAEDPEFSRNQLVISVQSNDSVQQFTGDTFSSWMILVFRTFALAFFKLLASLVWKVGTS